MCFGDEGKKKKEKGEVSGLQNSAAWFEYKWLTVISMLGSLSLITVFQTRLIWQLSSQNMLNTSYSITLRSPIPFPPREYFLIGRYNLEALDQKQIISDYLLVLCLVWMISVY